MHERLMNPSLNTSCWPTRSQELLLQACLLPDAEAGEALREWRAKNSCDALDLVSSKILALLFRRHGERGLDRDLYNRAYISYCATWQRNEKRLLWAPTLMRD